MHNIDEAFMNYTAVETHTYKNKAELRSIRKYLET